MNNKPEIAKLMGQNENLEDFLELKSDELLLRWVNLHLKAAEKPQIKNFGEDLKDSKALLYFLNQLDEDQCPLDKIDAEDPVKRAQAVLENAKVISDSLDISCTDSILKGDEKSNTLFISLIFTMTDGKGLEEDEEVRKTETEYQQRMTRRTEELIEFCKEDQNGLREDRAYRVWINSLAIDGVYVNDLLDDLANGVAFCKILDTLEPGCIDWSKVDLKPRTDFQKAINCNVAIAVRKMIGFTGMDIQNIQDKEKIKKKRKSVLALVSNIARSHHLQVIGDKTESDLVAWANNLVGDKAPAIANLSDPKLSDGKYLMQFLAAIEPLAAINWKLI